MEVAILMTASTSSLVGMTVDEDSLTAEETKEEAAVLGLPCDDEATVALPGGLCVSEGLGASL